MVLFQITALVILILGIAWCFRVKFVEAVPPAVSLLVLVLYVLCFFRGLWASDYLAIAVLAAAVIYVLRLKGDGRKRLFQFAGHALTDAGTITAIAMTVIVTLCVSSKVVSWWDDYNFWATDVKSLFFLNGFADKYANVAPEFGDYPPGTQMMKWWFLHFSPKEFREGLMFAGYYFMNLAFLFPFLKFIKKRNPVIMLLAGALLWLFPTTAEIFWVDGCCADLTMAVIYGAFLVSVTDRGSYVNQSPERNGAQTPEYVGGYPAECGEGHLSGLRGEIWYFGRQALYLAVLVLCKNTGFIWVAFGLLFSYGYHFLMHRREGTGKEQKRRDRRWLFLVTLLPVLAEISWLGFCLINRRVAKLTGTAIQMVTGGMNIPEYQEAMVNAFVEAFVKWPLHRGRTFAIDLSPLALYLILVIGVFLLWRFRLLEKKQAVYVGIFLALSGVIFYTFNLISHLTIFAVETQYLEPYGMVSSIERYGSPFMIGGMCLLAYLIMKNAKSRKGMAVCALFILLTADYTGAYRGIWGYRDTVDTVLEERAEIINQAAKQLLSRIGAGESESIGRVLYLRDISDVSWVRNTYISFEAAPVSMMYGNVDTQSFSEQDLINAVADAHADFVYVDELQGNGQELFASFLDGQELEYGCLYQVSETDGGMEMRKYARD